MKWDEIHDQSRVFVDKAIENLLAEGKEVEQEESDIVEKLRDAEYVGKKLEKRKCYSGKDAFLRLKRQMKRKKRLRVAMWMASAACVAVVCKAGKYFSGGDESNIGASGRGTSRVRKRAS